MMNKKDILNDLLDESFWQNRDNSIEDKIEDYSTLMATELAMALDISIKVKNFSLFDKLCWDKYDINMLVQFNTNILANIVEMDKHPEYLIRLLQNGVNPNQIIDKGETPLHWMAEDGNIEFIDILLQYGADINKGINSLAYKADKPIVNAIRSKDIETISHLIIKGTNINEKMNQFIHKGTYLSYIVSKNLGEKVNNSLNKIIENSSKTVTKYKLYKIIDKIKREIEKRDIEYQSLIYESL